MSTDMVRKRFRTFLVAETPPSYGNPIQEASHAAGAARAILADYDADKEHFLVLALNARGKVCGFKVIATGTLTGTLIHMREVFRAAMFLDAAQIIVVHNHPSGDPNPSDEDVMLTDRLVEAGRLLGIPVLDHLVLTSTDFRSIPPR
jgi:DNA repair protein RadC